MNTWYCLEPHTYLNIQENDVILKNTHSNQYLEFVAQPKIANFLSSRYVALEEDGLDEDIKTFVEASAALNIGDIVEAPYAVDLIPTTVPEGRFNFKTEDDDLFLYKGQLWKCVVYLNAIRNQDMGQDYQIHKQFPFYKYANKPEQQLSIKQLENFLAPKFGDLLVFHFYGGDIFEHPDLLSLPDRLSVFNSVMTFSNSYHNYLGREEWIQKMLLHDNLCFNILVAPSFNVEKLKEVHQLFIKNNHEPNYVFVVKKEEELELIEDFVEKNDISKVDISAFSDGKNDEFMKEFVFLTKDEIIENTGDTWDIEARQQINQHNYGILTIDNNGDIYGNVNFKNIGNVKNTSLKDVLNLELTGQGNWKKTRHQMKPCKDCMYQSLCPSPSGYEYFLNKNNLCFKG